MKSTIKIFVQLCVLISFWLLDISYDRMWPRSDEGVAYFTKILKKLFFSPGPYFAHSGFTLSPCLWDSVAQ
ncbi:hypothetical protein CSA56_05325 [candidate division KSB3 bacterium]|uniref:Uncharacterized protein n=1 Tax=candidate division KSB3 bacterium TaxID=2044937 RepID=A0A2G6KHM1_9BACT|nr:MAG: hypothetical protein CSA56_05325 [candidate division KSB3 bacterium]